MTSYALTTPLLDEKISGLNVGKHVTFTGVIYTARDAAHKRLIEMADEPGHDALCAAEQAYILRAISPGSFHQPAATVEDMYRPDYRARTEAGRRAIRYSAVSLVMVVCTQAFIVLFYRGLKLEPTTSKGGSNFE